MVPDIPLRSTRLGQQMGTPIQKNKEASSTQLSGRESAVELSWEISIDDLKLGGLEPVRWGGFGVIYRIIYRDTDAAVKVLSDVMDEQEVAEFQR